jgi:hypothetical protein
MVVWCLLLSLLMVGQLLASPLSISENLPDLASLEANLEASLLTEAPAIAEVLPYQDNQVKAHDLNEVLLPSFFLIGNNLHT